MAVDRTTPTSGPMGGPAYAAAVNEEVAALWNRVPVYLSNVVGVNSIAASATPTLDAYAPGQAYYLIPVITNTGPVEINIDGRGIYPVNGPDGVALSGGELAAGRVVLLHFDGTAFRYMSAAGNFIDIAPFKPGKPLASALFCRYVFRLAVTFPVGLVMSRASSEIMATAQAVFSIRKNGVQFGTCTFGAGSTTGVLAAASLTQFAAGDVLTIVPPVVADDTLADVSITLAGNR